MSRRAVSIAAEIDDLRAALSAVRILADELTFDHIADCEDARAVPAAISAVMTLVDARARQVARALRRDVDPGSILGRSNRAVPKTNETVLTAWSDEEQRADALRTLRRLGSPHTTRRSKR